MGIYTVLQLRLSIQFLENLASTMVMPFLAMYFAKRVGETLTGIMFVIVLLAGNAGGILVGYFGDKMGIKKVMIIRESIVAFTLLLIAWMNAHVCILEKNSPRKQTKKAASERTLHSGFSGGNLIFF